MNKHVGGAIVARQFKRISAILQPGHPFRLRLNASQLRSFRSVSNDQQPEFAGPAGGQNAERFKKSRRIFFRRQPAHVEKEFLAGSNFELLSALRGIVRFGTEVVGINPKPDQPRVSHPPRFQDLRQRLGGNEGGFEPVIHFAHVALRRRHE